MSDRESWTTGEPEVASSATRIGEVAARTGLSLRSLRHWEEVGLLRPTGRSEGGYRLYTEGDVERILVIRRMKPLGFSLEEMSAVVRDIEKLSDISSDQAAEDELRRRLRDVWRKAADRREKLVEQLDMADEFISLMSEQLGRTS